MKDKIFVGIAAPLASSLIINNFNLNSIEAATAWLGSSFAMVASPILVASLPLIFKSKFNYHLFQNLSLFISFVILSGHALSERDKLEAVNDKYNKMIMQQLDEPANNCEARNLSGLALKSLEQCVTGDLSEKERELLEEALKRNIIK